MRRAVRSESARLGERARVALVGLHLAAAGGVHRGEVRVGDDDLVAESFEVAGDPLALRARLDQDASKRASAEQVIDMFAVGLDAALDELAVFGADADLAGDFPQIETDEVHGYCSFRRGLMPQCSWSRMLPLPAASRFIQSFL
jgi:hypothetical protein